MSMKNVLVLLCVAAMSSGAFAWTMLGPATAELDPGQWSAGYSYTYAESDVDYSIFGISLSVDDVEIERHYFDLGYGVAENWELNLLLGVTGVDSGSPVFMFDGSSDFSWGFNTKYTFIDDEKIDWGVMYQMTWFNPEDSGVEIDGYDVQIAAGPTIDMGGWDLYCGAWYYMFDADVEAFGLGLGSLEEEDNFGGYVGAGFQIMQNTDLNIEYGFSSNSMAIGASIEFRF